MDWTGSEPHLATQRTQREFTGSTLMLDPTCTPLVYLKGVLRSHGVCLVCKCVWDGCGIHVKVRIKGFLAQLFNYSVCIHTCFGFDLFKLASMTDALLLLEKERKCSSQSNYNKVQVCIV